MSIVAKTDIKLLKFFIYNSTLGPREGEEHKKILYYFPPDTDIDTQCRDVGLCEAIVKFTETFNTGQDGSTRQKAVHTQKTRQVFVETEPDYWLVMTVMVPVSRREVEPDKTTLEYHDEDVQNSVFHRLLEHTYLMFRLFNGTMAEVAAQRGGGDDGVESLRQRLARFFPRYLETLDLQRADLLDVFTGLHFLPLDKNTYLKIQCAINSIEASFPCLRQTAFLYNEQLVWSGLGQEDMRMLYRYLTTKLFPTFLEGELSPRGATSAPPSHPVSPPRPATTPKSHFGKFMTGPSDLTDVATPVKVPKIFITTTSQDETTPRLTECHLLVYRALSATLCLVVDGTYQLNFDFYRALDAVLGPQLTTLASDIAEPFQRRPAATPGGHQPSGTTDIRYVYFNQMNLAQKSTVHADMTRRTIHNTPPNIIKLLNSVNAALGTADDDCEMIMKADGDYWVVGKKSDRREFYVVLNQKKANLIEVNEEVKKLSQMHFNNIFFLD